MRLISLVRVWFLERSSPLCSYFVGLEYEGIYRKTGGSRLCKVITQLFERGDYDAFDLADIESFNDISSVTSVLKTYFRQLPNPLLTHALHESFVAAASKFFMVFHVYKY